MAAVYLTRNLKIEDSQIVKFQVSYFRYIRIDTNIATLLYFNVNENIYVMGISSYTHARVFIC